MWSRLFSIYSCVSRFGAFLVIAFAFRHAKHPRRKLFAAASSLRPPAMNPLQRLGGFRTDALLCLFDQSFRILRASRGARPRGSASWSVSTGPAIAISAKISRAGTGCSSRSPELMVHPARDAATPTPANTAVSQIKQVGGRTGVRLMRPASYAAKLEVVGVGFLYK